MSHVVIVESPAKCKTINKYLGKDYKVLASYGHIRDLPSKDGSVVPDEDFDMKYYIPTTSKKHIKQIEDAVKGSSSLILATDPDREGEAISWHVYEVLRKKKIIDKDFPVKRVAFNSITKAAVNKAMEDPRDLDINLVNSQQARRALDYLVGFTLSPVLWRKLPGSRSAGRVQSVALRLVCERETEIERFNPQEYWSIHAVFENNLKITFKTSLTVAEGEKLKKLSIENKEQADRYLAEILKREFKIASIEKKQTSRSPKPPFTTSTLQQEASRKLGFSAKKTMQVAQKLYEGFDIGGETTGLITYMRTDGVSVAPEALEETRNAIQKNYGEKYLPEKPKFYKVKTKNTQEAHEAIRPTSSSRKPEQVSKYLDKDQLKLYDLIWKRMIASQMTSAVFDQVAANISSEDEKYSFRATGKTLVFDGFYKLYREGIDDGEDEDKEEILPELKEGEALTFADVDKDNENPRGEQHFTQPPPRYNEASLVKKLEELGIGRPSTYAAILSILIDRGYVKIEQRRFFAEPRGRVVTAFLEEFFNKYVQYDFTAELEEKLDLISEGKEGWKETLHSFWGDFKANIDKATDLKLTDVIDHLDKSLETLFFKTEDGKTIEEARKCPSCGDGKLNLKLGKFGPFLGCSNYPDCKHTVQIDKVASNENDSDADSDEPKKAQFETQILGADDSTGKDITLRKGPYGFYLQVGEQEGKVKPKRTGLPRGMKPEDVDFDKAKRLVSFPLTLGQHPETGEDVILSIGKYGPYLSHNKKFVSIKDQNLVFNIALEEAVEMINNAPEKKAKSKKK